RYSSEDIFRGVNFDEIFSDLGFGFGRSRSSGFGSIFDVFFGGGSRSNQRYSEQGGNDLRYDLDISLEEAYTGLKPEIEFLRNERCDVCNGSGAKPGSSPVNCSRCGGTGQIQHKRASGFAQFIQIQTCDKCRGQGTVIEHPCTQCKGGGVVQRSRKIRVTVPAGVDSGFSLRLTGQGEPAHGRGPPGDLYVVVQVRPHEIFARDGKNLFINLPINVPQAALGAEVEVPSLDGKAKLKVPAGTQSGTLFKLAGKGMPDTRGYSRGDELIRVIVKTPTNLTSRQKELLKEIAAEIEDREKPKGRFFV
ncbi:MAG: DnaJ C-terminal domain-containing protein, partial [Candidatus Bathyarchaeia archaeon]